MALDPALQRGCAALAAELRSWLDRPRIERLKDGIRVVVAGPPNAGKSSLLNELVGEERAIVTNVPGTTRDHIEVSLSLGGVPILLTDTAGLRDSLDEVEEIGVARARTLIDASDLLLWLGAPDEAPPHPRTTLLHAKSDLPERSSVPAGSLAVSSVTGAGIIPLLHHIEVCARDALIPAEDSISLNHRQARHIAEAEAVLNEAAAAHELILLAENLRVARGEFDRLTGRAGVEDVLDALFSRFCLGK